MKVGSLGAPRRAVVVVLSAIAAGAGVSAPESLAAADAGLQQPSTRMETYDDLLVRVEKQAPGFGGMYIDPDGRLAVYLLDPAQLPAARSAIEAVFGSNRVPAAGVRAVQGQYAVSQLKAWTERAATVLKLPGVAFVDLDEAKNRVAIGVEDDSRRQSVEEALRSLKIPREAMLIDVTGPIRPIGAR